MVGYHDGSSVVVTGYVRDIREYMSRATVSICPMRVGSGIKNKVLESMAMGRAVVATGLACDGVPGAENGRNIFIEDTASGFADSVIRLIRDGNLRERTGRNAREFVTKNYTWRKTAEKIEGIYREALR